METNNSSTPTSNNHKYRQIRGESGRDYTIRFLSLNSLLRAGMVPKSLEQAGRKLAAGKSEELQRSEQGQSDMQSFMDWFVAHACVAPHITLEGTLDLDTPVDVTNLDDELDPLTPISIYEVPDQDKVAIFASAMGGLKDYETFPRQ